MEKALDELGFTPLFKGLKARPARPTKLYRKGEKFRIDFTRKSYGSLSFLFYFAKKIINLLSGNLDNPLTFYGKMGMDLKLKSGRNNLILGNLEKDIFTPFNENKFGSGMILPLIKSEFLLISEENTSELKKGDEITLLKI